jgi:hypothetical protein
LAVGLGILAVVFLGAVGPVSAGPQRGRVGKNPLPAQRAGNSNPFNPYGPYFPGKYTPYPVKDPTAAERVEIAGRAYRRVLDEWGQQAMTPPGPGAKRPDADALFPLELAERLGQWSLRWQGAQDNVAKTLADRYQALSDHLARMSSLEDGRVLREAVKPGGFPAGRPAELNPPRVFAEVARFFRPIDGWGFDRVLPELVEFERPLNPLGVEVTPAERVKISGRVYGAILDAAVDRFLAAPRAGEARRDEAAILDATLAERLAFWSDMWRQAQDDLDASTSWRSPAARNGSARLALAGTRLGGPDTRPVTVKSHIERMSALETGRFLHDALKRAGRPADQPIEMTRLRDFAEIARFFRIDAESRLSEAASKTDADATASTQAMAAGRIYHAILDEAAQRYLEAQRAGKQPPDARLVFDLRLAERLGSWSIRWGRAQAGAGGDRGSRYAAVQSHLDRMASLEEGRSLHDALVRAGSKIGGRDAPAPPREIAEVARFFRLEAQWELALIKSR